MYQERLAELFRLKMDLSIGGNEYAEYMALMAKDFGITRVIVDLYHLVDVYEGKNCYACNQPLVTVAAA